MIDSFRYDFGNLPAGGKAMEGTTQITSPQIFTEEFVTEDFIGEHRLWAAVIVTAVEDWRNGTLRARREAQRFLFDDDQDFNRACAGAGLDPSSFRAKLLKISHRSKCKVHRPGHSLQWPFYRSGVGS